MILFDGGEHFGFINLSAHSRSQIKSSSLRHSRNIPIWNNRSKSTRIRIILRGCFSQFAWKALKFLSFGKKEKRLPLFSKTYSVKQNVTDDHWIYVERAAKREGEFGRERRYVSVVCGDWRALESTE